MSLGSPQFTISENQRSQILGQKVWKDMETESSTCLVFAHLFQFDGFLLDSLNQ